MSRRYTAQEMRDAALALISEIGFVDDSVEAIVSKAERMLIQAADDLEGEAKREKKYEYGVLPPGINGVYQSLSAAELKASMLKCEGYQYPIVRRSVGEWEEVEDAQ